MTDRYLLDYVILFSPGSVCLFLIGLRGAILAGIKVILLIKETH